MFAEYWPALILGFFGSLHCVGMCGPIALAVPHRKNQWISILVDNLLYNGGRVITYGLMGLVIGLIGKSLNLAAYQEIVSITVGSLLLIYLIVPRKWYSGLTSSGLFTKISGKFKHTFANFMRSPKIGSLFVVGLLNGMLPCGLVYIALAASIPVGEVYGPAFYMIIFGLGTFPMMSLVYIVKKFISIDFRRKLTKLVPVGIAVVAIMLILRGMSLGIPYVSPKLPVSVEQKADCCH